MKKQLEQLKEFHHAFGLGWRDDVSELSEEEKNFRITLMNEEMNEAIAAMKDGAPEDIAKELADVLYVVYGTIGECGLADKMERIFDEVHKSNMSKLGPEGKPLYREDGKVLKGPHYAPPDIKSILS